MTKLKYTPEIRERAVQLLIESEKDYPSTWAAITAISPKIGCTPETLRVWYQKYLDQQNPVKIQQIGVVCGRGRNPTLRLWPAIFSGEIDVFPSERRNMGQEIGR